MNRVGRLFGHTTARRLWFGVASLIGVLLTGWAEAKDVTAQVIREADLDEQIADACHKHCKGNKRHGTLTRVLVTRSGPSRFAVSANANLVNRHDPVRHVTAWSYTIQVEAHGTLDETTCQLRIDRISLTNDRLHLGPLARREEGKVHRIKDCQRFLTGL